MEKKIYFLVSLFWLLVYSSFAQFEQVAQLTEYPDLDHIASDMLGASVAIDGNIAVVGSGFADDNFVTVMEFNGNTWEKMAVLTPSNGVAGDNFGSSVGVFGDVIIVGAYTHASSGVVYLFEKPTSGWTDKTEDAILTTSDAATTDYFGISVDIYGDIVVVGAQYSDAAISNGGAVYVFEKPISGWVSGTEKAILTASDAVNNHFFGVSVRIFGDVIVAGAVRDTDNGLSSGAAYVFEKPIGSWASSTQTAKLTASDGTDYDFFGQTVGISEHYIIVGAFGDDDNGSSSGSAYIFEKPSGSWATATETVKLRPLDGNNEDRFGYAVDISDQYAIIGAYMDDDNGSSSGSAILFDNLSGSWIENSKLLASDGAINDEYSKAVAISDNYIVIGAPGKTVDTYAQAGSAYLFQAPLTWTGASSTDWNTAANWDFNKIPHFYDDVFITEDVFNYPEISSEANCYDFELEVMASAYIMSDASSSGSLIIKGTYTGDPYVEYHRYMTGNQWHLLGSPFEDNYYGNTIYDLMNDGTNYKMKDYIENTDQWSAHYTVPIAGSMPAGKGYAVKKASNGTVLFQGTPNTVAVNVSLTREGMGWNLLSNPFTSAIAITDDAADVENYLLNTTNLAVLDPSFQAMYVWVEDTEDPTKINNYKVINNGATGTLVQDYLQTAQGFFVKSISGGGSFELTPAMQTHQTSIPFKKVENAAWASIILSAETVDTKATTKLVYGEEMTRGLDPSYDAGLLDIGTSFDLYTKLVDDNGVDFMVQCLPADYENLVVPIGLEAEAGSTITFKAQATNLPEDYAVVLEDRENGTFTTLETEQSVYTVTLENASIGTGRFYLHTSFKSALGANDLDQARFSVYAQASNNQLLINGNVEEKTTATVYDVQGRLVQRFALQNGAQNRLSFNQETGVYIIKIQNAKGIVNQKFNWVK